MKTIFKILTTFFAILFITILIATLIGHTDFGNFEKSEANLPFISVINEDLRYIQKGSGPDILLIHGTPGSIEDWDELIDSLALNHRVTAFDRPGFGFSTANNCDYSIHQNVDIVNALVKELDLKNPFFIGHSYGGSILANMIVTQEISDQSKIMIIDSPLFGHDVDPALKLMTLPIIGKGNAIISKYTIGPNKIENGIRNLLVTIIGKPADEFVNRRLKMWLQPKVIFATANERSNYDRDLKSVSNVYKNIPSDIPITILTGTSPNHTLVNDCTQLKKVIPFANLKKFEKCGHYVQVEKSNQVLDIIRSMSKI